MIIKTAINTPPSLKEGKDAKDPNTASQKEKNQNRSFHDEQTEQENFKIKDLTQIIAENLH